MATGHWPRRHADGGEPTLTLRQHRVPRVSRPVPGLGSGTRTLIPILSRPLSLG